VRDVEYGREWLDKLEALGRGLRAFGAGALLAVIGAALMVVANTIRLAVYARGDEIEIMKLVGATDGYVRAPFLMEGALQGVLGAGVAVGVVLAAQHWLLPHASQAFAVAAGVGAPHLLPAHAAALLAAGAVVGFVGSWIAAGHPVPARARGVHPVPARLDEHRRSPPAAQALQRAAQVRPGSDRAAAHAGGRHQGRARRAAGGARRAGPERERRGRTPGIVAGEDRPAAHAARFDPTRAGGPRGSGA